MLISRQRSKRFADEFGANLPSRVGAPAAYKASRQLSLTQQVIFNRLDS